MCVLEFHSYATALNHEPLGTEMLRLFLALIPSRVTGEEAVIFPILFLKNQLLCWE